MTETSLIAMSVMTAKNVLAGLDGTLDPDLVVNKSVLTSER
jgi:D-3-phosphoglycerate dehydrogenase / 2-oxoglutarate reductase